ncbi:hypothetical protein [Streptomyces flaveolus]|nr:hypothetical protein [Streptomyces flaveolus]
MRRIPPALPLPSDVHRADGATMAHRLDALKEYLLRCCPPGCGA